MRIATYNLWNDDRGMPARLDQILQTIMILQPDVIGLQEVCDEVWQALSRGMKAYPCALYCRYPGEDEGLALLSKFSLISHHFLCAEPDRLNCMALHVLLEAPFGTLSVTNVHLPWDSCRERERQAVEIDRWIAQQKAGQHVLLGDFNADLGDSVDRFLTGNQTLREAEALPHWCDLARAIAARRGEETACTLDILHNPRWAGSKSIYTPSVMDRIYLRDTWDEVSLEDVFLFGKDVSPVSGYAPSDHWGVAADISLS